MWKQLFVLQYIVSFQFLAKRIIHLLYDVLSYKHNYGLSHWVSLIFIEYMERVLIFALSLFC